MARSAPLQVAQRVLFALPLLVGCAAVGQAYRPQSETLQSRFTIIENFGTAPLDPAQVDALLLDVAALLHVPQLDPTVPKARIIITTPSRIASLYRATMTLGHGQEAEGLYFPGASLVMVPYFDRVLLGHELAHYITDHYLKGTPRSKWERIARSVEDRIQHVRRPASPPVVVAEGTPPAGPVTQ